MLPLDAIARDIRADVIDALSAIGHEHRGHPGASLSIVDIVTALYFDVMRVDPAAPADPDRDRFVLSKGHGCMALYAALARRGFFDRAHLRTFRHVDSLLQGHPDMRKTPGIDMTSGSLGHGLPAAVGMALDARMRDSPSITYVLLGDGELQEGLVWEGAMAAAKYRLDRLVAIVDCNGLQSSGRVADIMPIEPLAAKWEAFGWRVADVDGHDVRRIAEALRARAAGTPTVVLARTVKGKGDPRMEGDNRWHQACPAIAPAAPAVDPRGRPMASCRAAFGDVVLALWREGRPIAVVTSDTCASMGLDAFARAAPHAHVEVGIAEQNLVTVAAGLAANGRTVIAATYATFASMRTLEQIRTFLAYPNLRVIVAAGLGGLSGGIEGVAHEALEDIGVLRCVPNLVIMNPADAGATRAMMRAAADHAGPVYLRLGRDDSPVLFDEPYSFAIGRGQVLARHGDEVALLTSGPIAADVLEAAERLASAGIGCTVAEFPTIKPIDADLIVRMRGHASHLFAIEEHGTIGGLGSAVADVLTGADPAVLHRIGIDDRFLESGSPRELRAKYGLTAGAIAARVRETVTAAERHRPQQDVSEADRQRRRGNDPRPGERHRREQDEHRRRRTAKQ